MTAELADEAATGLERAMHTRNHELWPAHPVQYRIDSIELALEGQRMAVNPLHLNALGSSSGQQLLGEIGAKNIGARSGDLLGQHAVAAAKVEDPLAALGRQQVDSGTGKLGDETPLVGIVVSRPALHRLRRCHFGGAHSVCPGCHGS